MEKSIIQEFYKGTNVFITGGTGFMGKALIEKLLRDKEVETIYLLIRDKKGKTPLMRVEKLFDNILFERLKSEKPKFQSKIVAIPGDCSMKGLGISITDRQTLISNVNIVFHAAATIKFDEHIQLAYSINVNGTKDVLNLAKEIENLKSLIHVSTAYSNCNRKEIDEIIYDHPLKCSDAEAFLEQMTKDEAKLCTKKILEDWPNTYTFTNALAESLIKNEGNRLPIGIFRPSIVVSTFKEPIEGWIDNLNGAAGTSAATFSGVLKVARMDLEKLSDMVPVDTCVAGILAMAWDVGQKEGERNSEKIPVYNYVSAPENPLLWEEFVKLNYIHGIKYPVTNGIWYPSTFTTTTIYMYWLLKLFLHILPATIIDLITVLMGNKPRLLSLYKKIHKLTEVLDYFCLREWTFSNKNVQTLWKKMNKTDQELFPFSMTTVLWTKYYRVFIKGIRNYVLKQPDSMLEISRTKNGRFMILHRILGYTLIFLASNMVSSLLLRFYNVMFS